MQSALGCCTWPPVQTCHERVNLNLSNEAMKPWCAGICFSKCSTHPSLHGFGDSEMFALTQRCRRLPRGGLSQAAPTDELASEIKEVRLGIGRVWRGVAFSCPFTLSTLSTLPVSAQAFVSNWGVLAEGQDRACWAVTGRGRTTVSGGQPAATFLESCSLVPGGPARTLSC